MKISESTSYPFIVELHGPKAYSPEDVRGAFELVTGKKIELKLVERDQLRPYYSEIFPPPVVDLFVEMTESLLPGGILMKGDPKNPPLIHRGTDTLVDSVQRMMVSAG